MRSSIEPTERLEARKTRGSGQRFSTAARASPIHLLTTATLDRLQELYPRGRFESRRYRPNLVVSPSPSEKGFIELNWIGRTLAVGPEVRLSIVGPCPRCVMTTLAQGDLPKDPGILQTAARHTPRITVEGFGELSANVG